MYIKSEVDGLTIMTHENKVLCFESDLTKHTFLDGHLLEKTDTDLFKIHDVCLSLEQATELGFYNTENKTLNADLFMQYLENELHKGNPIGEYEPLQGSQQAFTDDFVPQQDARVESIYDDDCDIEEDYNHYYEDCMLPPTLYSLNLHDLDAWFK